MAGSGTESSDKYQQKMDELEKRIIDHDLNTIKQVDEKENVSSKLKELRDNYTNLIKEKVALQKQLYNAEEDKINLSKALLELQIENARIHEMMRNTTLENQKNNVHDEADDLEMRMKLEKAQKLVQDLQAELSKVLDEKKELELEFVAIRKNFLNKTNELDNQTQKNQKLQLEIVNLLNENEALMKNHGIQKPSNTVNSDFEDVMKHGNKLENEISKLKEEIIKLNTDLERARAEKLKAEIAAERAKVDYEDRAVKLEKESLRMPNSRSDLRQPNPGENEALKKVEKEQWEKDKFAYQRRCRELQRKLDATVRDFEEAKEEIKKMDREKGKIMSGYQQLQVDYRKKLANGIEDNAADMLVKSYKDHELSLKNDIENSKKRIETLQNKCREIRTYSRDLHALAEDLLPDNQPKPGILVKPEPSIIKDEKDARISNRLLGSNPEIDHLKDENLKLKAEIKGLLNSKSKGSNGLQLQILEELKALKGDPKQLSRPGTASADVETLRKERNQLLEENMKLKQLVYSCYINLD